jgi:hypothetical protein
MNRRRFRQRLLVVFLLVMLVPYVRQMVVSPTLGQDFRAFFAAATVAAQHQDPYDWTRLGRVEDRLYNQPAGLHPGDASYYDFLPFPEGPWLAYTLAPLSGLPWPVAYAVFATVMALLLALAAFSLFRMLGWPWRRAALGTACTLLSAIGFLNIFMGQVSIVVLAAFVGAWVLAERGHPSWAGIVLTLVWIKPNIGLPLPLVLMLMEPAIARRIAIAFITASAAAFGGAVLTLGYVILQWPLQSVRMWQSVQSLQPDIASLQSFFYPALSGWLKTAALLLSLLAAVVYGAWALRRAPDPVTRGITVLLVWLFALPFVQSYDLVLLLPALGILLGPRLEGWEDPVTEISLWLLVTVPLLYFVGLRLGSLNGFSAIPFALLMIAWHRRMLVLRPQPALQPMAA